MGTDESVNYSGSSRSERGAQNFLPANLERQLHFQIRTLAPRVQNQESRAKGSFNSSWFWGRQCPLMADCRPPSKASSFATSDHGRAWYATRKLTLVNATTEVRRSAIGAGLVMA